MSLNQNGFTAIVLLIIFIVVIATGGVAYSVTKTAQNEPAEISVAADTPEKVGAVTKAQEEAALETVKKLYDGYQVIESDMSNSRMNELEPLRQATTASPFVYPAQSSPSDAEADQPGGADPIICAQSGFDSVTYGKPVVKEGKVVVPVIEVFEEPGTITIFATVDVTKNKIVAIQCPIYDN